MKIESRDGPVEVSLGDMIAIQHGRATFEGVVLEVFPYVNDEDHGYFRLLVYDYNDAAKLYWDFNNSIFEESFAQSTVWAIDWAIEIKYNAS